MAVSLRCSQIDFEFVNFRRGIQKQRSLGDDVPVDAHPCSSYCFSFPRRYAMPFHSHRRHQYRFSFPFSPANAVRSRTGIHADRLVGTLTGRDFTGQFSPRPYAWETQPPATVLKTSR